MARGRILLVLGSVVGLAFLPAIARAAELVNLSDGYVQRCDHHAIVDGRIRAYLSAGEDNYIDYEPVQVSSIEIIPDPPPAVPASLKPPSHTHLTRERSARDAYASRG